MHLERSLAPSQSEIQSKPQRSAATSPASILNELATLRRSITEMEKDFARADPDYVPFARPLEMNDIVELAKAVDAVIVEFRLTREGTFVFLVGPNDKEVSREQVVEISRLQRRFSPTDARNDRE